MIEAPKRRKKDEIQPATEDQLRQLVDTIVQAWHSDETDPRYVQQGTHTQGPSKGKHYERVNLREEDDSVEDST